jgi:hypothetical protein
MGLDEMARYANKVLTLKEGGSLVGYESSAAWISENPLRDDISEEVESTEPEKEEKPIPRQPKKPQEEDQDELVKRKVGDATVWYYYGKSVGIWPVLLLVLFTAIATMGGNFPR